MTGTSLDGIDISLVKTNGLTLERLNQNYFHEYSNSTKDFLLDVINNDINANLNKKNALDRIVTKEHIKALKNLNIINKCDLIGFHGQTIYHDPEKKISLQLGQPQILSDIFKKNVIFNFRSVDIELGGQGAPLAPIYHQNLIQNLGLSLPSCILNIGGVSNLTFWDGNTLIGFDTGPGNALMDDYVKKISSNYFDVNGNLASSGKPKKEFVQNFLSDDFFKKPFPKSLDRNQFIDYYYDLLQFNLSDQDVMATLAEFTIQSILSAIKLLPKKVENMLVSGGGSKNLHVIKSLKNNLEMNFIHEKDINLNFDFIESELIAFLSARSIYNLPFTFPSTTGVSIPSSGGDLYKYL